MEIEPDIENMTLNEYLGHEANKESIYEQEGDLEKEKAEVEDDDDED
nr:hypothetical protein [Tanacetum cinerariifolium]